MLWWLWTWPTTDAGFQIIATVLAACNFVLCIDAFLPYYKASHHQTFLLMATHFGKMVAFLMTVAITGANPRYSRLLVMPWSRRVWAIVSVLLLLYVISKTWTIFKTWRQEHQKSTAQL